MTDKPTAEDHLGPISKLQARLAERAKTVGLQLIQSAVIVSHRPDGNHVMQCVFLPTDEPPPPDDETKDLLEGIAEATRRGEQEAKADQAREDLAALADETKPDAKGEPGSSHGEMGPRSRGIGLDD